MTHRAHRAAVLLTAGYTTLALTAAMGLGGCSLANSTDATTITKNFISAMQNRDWEKACQYLAHDFIHRHMNDESRYCVQYLEQWHGTSNTFEAMAVTSQDTEPGPDGTVVTVELADGSTDQARVVNEEGDLKLARYPGQNRAAR